MNVIISTRDLESAFRYYITQRHTMPMSMLEQDEEWKKFHACLLEAEAIIEERKPIRAWKVK